MKAHAFSDFSLVLDRGVEMHIEELVLEGFKSYPVRTQITGWDPSFNCITGLNGSGKSNILDAICFVLGLTNMSQVRFQKQPLFGYNEWLTERVERVSIYQVRAQNQQDLIYKRGQAGVTRASVTVVFNNSDKSKSPIGFEQLAQITVTRQVSSDKYFGMTIFLYPLSDRFTQHL